MMFQFPCLCWRVTYNKGANQEHEFELPISPFKLGNPYNGSFFHCGAFLLPCVVVYFLSSWSSSSCCPPIGLLEGQSQRQRKHKTRHCVYRIKETKSKNRLCSKHDCPRSHPLSFRPMWKHIRSPPTFLTVYKHTDSVIC